MPGIRGESVGSAYVRIYADGSEVPDGIRDALEDAEPSVRKAGKDHGEAYSEEFERQQRKHFVTTKGEMFEDLNDSLTNALERLNLSDDFFKSSEWKKFNDRLEREFGSAGRLAGKSLEKEFRDNTNLDQLAAAMENIGPRVRRAQDTILGELHTDAIRINKAFDERLRQVASENDLVFRKTLKDNQEAITQFRNNIRTITTEVDKLERGQSKFRSGALAKMVEDLKRLAPNLNLSAHQIGLFDDRLEVLGRRLDHTTPILSRFDNGMLRIGNSMGRLFGKGSRNDFLNFFGSVVSKIAQLPRLLTGPLAFFSKLGRTMSEAFTEGGGGLSGTLAALGKGAGGIAGALASVAAAGVAFGAFIAFLTVVIGPLISIVSGLVAILLALGSSLLFAASSAIAFFPLLIPAAAIVAGVVAAVMDLKGATGELGKTMNSIGDRAGKLWEKFRTGIGASKGVARVLDEVNQALGQMGPLVDAAVKGFSRFAGQIADEMKGGAIDKFTDRFARFLPHAMKDLGTIFGNVFGGLAGVLRGAIPSANRLLDWLVKISDKFDKWANSKKGQNQIKDFLDKAADSAEAVGDFIHGAWDWLVKLIAESKSEGDNLWERIGGQFEEWAKWIDAHPDAFKQWMDDADDLATSIGEAVDGMTRLVDTLDSPQNRSTGNFFVSLIGGLSFFLGELSGVGTKITEAIVFGLVDPQSAFRQWGEGVLSWFSWFFGTLGRGVWFVIGGQWAGGLVDGITGALTAAGGWLAKQAQNLWSAIAGSGGGHGIGANIIDVGGITHAMTAVLESIGRLPGKAVDAARRAVDAFSGLSGRISNAAGSILGKIQAKFSPIPGMVSRYVDQSVARFGNFGERISRAAGDIWSQLSSKFTGLPEKIGGIVDAIVAKFIGLAARILAAVGPVIIHVGLDMPPIPGSAAKKQATGGLISGPTRILAGEEGPEAVVPLNRPLSMVDPAVRALSAFAQGKTFNSSTARTVDASGWTIVTPSRDPRVVAIETLDALVAATM